LRDLFALLGVIAFSCCCCIEEEKEEVELLNEGSKQV
jgi:hypothetical protein